MLELQVGPPDDSSEIVELWQDIVLAGLPVLRAAAEGFVVVVLRLLDEALQADVAPDLMAVMVKGQETQQARHPAIAVPERVNAEEIAHERGDDDDFGHLGLRGTDRPRQEEQVGIERGRSGDKNK